MDNLYITQSDIEVYDEIVKKQGFAPTLENKFEEIIKIYSNIIYPGRNEYIRFLRLGSSDLECFDYNYEEYIDIPIDFLKNENWQEILQKQIDDKNKKTKIDGMKHFLNRYFEIKDKAIEIAKEYALIKNIKKSFIEKGMFTFMTSPVNIENGTITVLFELLSICGEIDDQEVFIFPMELLVVDNWKEKLKEYHNSETELGSISIRR